MIKKRFIIVNIIILMIFITLTIGCIEDEDKTNGQETSSFLLTVKFNDYQVNYTLNDIESLDQYNGTGGYIKTKLLPESVEISDIYEFTGVRIKTLLDQIPNIPDKYNLNVVSEDEWTVTYTVKNTIGFVDVYNETGDIVSNKTADMIIAYKEDGEYYSEIDPGNEIGPLRIAFVGDDVITSSDLWSKMVVSIEIIALK